MTATYKTLVLSDFQRPATIEERQIPIPEPGSVVVKVLASYLLPYTKNILDGSLNYPLPLPLTPGGSCVGRIHSTGSDNTAFTEGQLVLCDPMIRARDDPATNFLLGVHSGFSKGSQKLMGGPWRDGSMAQFVKMPLENTFALNENALCQVQGYTIEELPLLQTLMIPFGGLDDAGVKVGDTVVVAPATGKFGGAAVLVALSLGAKVIACGRNENSLSKLSISMGSKLLETLNLKGDVEQDSAALQKLVGPNGADVYIDFSPPAAGEGGKTPSHVTACLNVLKRGGTCSLMGGVLGAVALPYSSIMFKNLVLKGKLMYEREQIEQTIKMAETGILKLGKNAGTEVVGPFGLENIEDAMDTAAALPGWGKNVVLVP
jgi:threonine dehydrogenase-like Zn-dependent dehydrogenase